MMRTTLAKYGAFCRVAAAQGRRERGELYGRVVFFAVILGVFSSLWRAVAEAGMPVTADPTALLWYLAVTEWIVLSTPLLHVEIQEAIRRGDVACQLGRPASYLGATFAEGIGALSVRAPMLGVTAFACAFALTGTSPSIGTLVSVVPFGLVAAALLTAMSLGIGLLAFWLEDVTPVHWLWQKLLFMMGGLMLPLELYPESFRTAAALTPFPTVLAGPASFMLPSGHPSAFTLARDLMLWSGVIGFALWWMFRRATAALTFNGG